MATGRTGPDQVLLTVGPQRLRLKLAGEAHSFEAPFDAAAFDPRRPVSEGWPNLVQSQGEALWTAAFSGSLGLLLDRAATGSALTLRIVAAPDLPAHLRWLPWETLFDPARRDYLALKSGWSLVRGIDPFQEARRMTTGGLLVLDLREAEEEVAAIREAARGRAPVEVLRPPDADALLRLVATSPASMVHLIADGEGESLPLAPPADDYVGARELAAAIAANDRIGLVVFSGSTGESVAEVVARHSAVAVLAHRTTVRDEHSLALSTTFYQALLDGNSADVALTETRRALDRQFPGQRAWTSAVLLTGWPPPVLPEPAGTGARSPGATAGRSADSLIELLHSRNRDRTAALLAVAEWEPLRQQHAAAEQHLAALRARRGR